MAGAYVATAASIPAVIVYFVLPITDALPEHGWFLLSYFVRMEAVIAGQPDLLLE